MSQITPTLGQRLLLDRLRRDETQAVAAARYEVPHGVYGCWERDQPTNRAVPKVKLGQLALHEKCLIARLQAGWTQREVAAHAGLCTYWIGCMERGEIPAERLATALGVK